MRLCGAQVRRAISIIPQEPVMFKGTVRSNLDPFGTSSDNELWHALGEPQHGTSLAS